MTHLKIKMSLYGLYIALNKIERFWENYPRLFCCRQKRVGKVGEPLSEFVIFQR